MAVSSNGAGAGIPKIHIDSDGMVRCNGTAIGRRVLRDGEVYLQVMDRNRAKAERRGSRFIEIPIRVLVDAMQFDWESSFFPESY